MTRKLLKLVSISTLAAFFAISTSTYAASHAGGKMDEKSKKDEKKDEKKK